MKDIMYQKIMHFSFFLSFERYLDDFKSIGECESLFLKGL